MQYGIRWSVNITVGMSLLLHCRATINAAARRIGYVRNTLGISAHRFVCRKYSANAIESIVHTNSGRRYFSCSYVLRSSSDNDAETGGRNSRGEKVDLGLVPVELESELQQSFMQYAMSTILSRALPDVRDGLKPVHRRILYAMHALGLSPDSSYRKCARVVGEVLGKYHPHGDSSVYEALVRMAQDFVLSHPLISGHGNFGSIDADPPAAMRYTESRLAPVARDILLQDVTLDTVDYIPNFDGSEKEPSILPARIPLLLLNGATGIAVGMATNIPPHNLGELAKATVEMIRNPELTDSELFDIIPAPDFPTGGIIMGTKGSRQLYSTANGTVNIRAKMHNESITQKNRTTRSAIIVTELPYLVNKALLLEKIAALVNEKKIEGSFIIIDISRPAVDIFGLSIAQYSTIGIADLRDESDREGIRIVIELKRDAIPQVVQNNLIKKTQLETSFSGNMLAVGENGLQPQRFTLRGILNEFIVFRFNVIRRRTAFELSKVKARDHIVTGILKALERAEEVVNLVRSSTDNASAKKVLMSEEYGLSDLQADAVLMLRLGRLTQAEGAKLQKEHDDLEKEILRLNSIMEHDAEVNSIMVSEIKHIEEKHSIPRRSVIMPEEDVLSEEDLLANDNSIIVITRSGYIKRMPLEAFQAQSRGTMGKAGAKMSDSDDEVAHFLTCRDHDSLLFISERGVAYGLRAFQVPKASRTAKGVPVPQTLPLTAEERISSVIPLQSFRPNEYLLLLTKRGWIKKTPLSAFRQLTARGLTILSLEEGDELIWVKVCAEDDHIIIGTKSGKAMRFAADSTQLRSSGRSSRGVTAMRFKPGDHPVDFDIVRGGKVSDGKSIIAITAKGYGKRVDIEEFKPQKRGGQGVIAIKFKGKANSDALRALRTITSEDELLLSTVQGNIVRQSADKISMQARSATGVLVQKLNQGDEIASIAIVNKELMGVEVAEQRT